MEAAGLAIGIVGLAGIFSTCIDCFHLIDIGRQHEHDSEILAAKFHIQYVRLRLWGDLVGLSAGGDCEESVAILPQQEFGVKVCLRGIHKILTSSRDLIDKYGLVNPSVEKNLGRTQAGERHSLPPAPITNIDKLKRAFVHALQKEVTGQASTATAGTRILWVIRDRERFQTLVEDLKDFIDGLHGVFPAVQPRHNRLVGRCINSVQEDGPLQLFIEATEAEYPDWSDTASIALHRTNRPGSPQQRVSHWLGLGTSVQNGSNQSTSDVNSTDYDKFASKYTENTTYDPIEIQRQRALIRRFHRECSNNEPPSDCVANLGADTDLSAKLYTGQTWTHVAVSTGRIDILEALFERGADMDVNLDEFGTPLISAAKENRGEMVTKLLAYGARTEAQDEHGRTAISYAVCHKFPPEEEMNGESCAVSALLERGAGVNARDAKGATPLHHALDWALKRQGKSALENFGFIEMILDRDADVTIKTHQGISILDLTSQVSPYDTSGTIVADRMATECIIAGMALKPRDKDTQDDIVAATAKSDVAYVKYLVWRHSVTGTPKDFQYQQKKALFTALKAKSREAVLFLLFHTGVFKLKRDVRDATPKLLTEQIVKDWLLDGATILHAAMASSNFFWIVVGVKRFFPEHAWAMLLHHKDNNGVTVKDLIRASEIKGILEEDNVIAD